MSVITTYLNDNKWIAAMLTVPYCRQQHNNNEINKNNNDNNMCNYAFVS